MTHFTFLLLVLPSTVLGASFKAFKNSKCNDPLTITSGNQTLPNNEILIDTAISDWNSTNGPAGHWYNKMGFVNATTSGTIAGTGANNVYWKVGDADPQCTYALMKQTHGPDEGWRILTPLPGQVTLMTQDEGCYYSSVNDFEGLITTYCCGEEECAGIHMGATLFVKRDLETKPTSRTDTPIGSKSVSHSPAKPRRAGFSRPPDALNESEWAPSTGSHSVFTNYHHTINTKRGLWDSIVDWFTGDDDEPEASTPALPVTSASATPTAPAGPSCTIVGEVQNIGITTGQQRIVTDPQSCDTGPGTCTHTVAVTFEASTALSHSQSSSWTVTGGTSVGVTAGINFLTQGTVQTTLTASVGHAWGQETGTTITTGWSNSTSQTIVQQVGTHAMLTFTPYYTCWKGDASCGLDAAGNEIKITDMEFCQPSLKQDGGDIIGTYGVVYL